MISMKVVSSPGSAASYFAKDNYYTRAQNEARSEWAGTLAAELGLGKDTHGRVDATVFGELLSGRIAGTELGRIVRNEAGEAHREHRPGYDITFSAPKSVSILAEVFGRTDVRQAHEAAVRTTLEFIERDFVRTRMTTNGVTVSVPTGKAIFALFQHNTSRSLDPQTHTHAVLLNITLREDGQYRAVDLGEFFKAKPRHYLDAIYKTELAKNLVELGYRIDKSGKGAHFEIAGFSRAQLEAFSQRAKSIEAKLAEHGTSREASSARHREVAFALTRDRKRQPERDTIIGGWEARARAVGIDPQRIVPSAPNHAGRDRASKAAQNLDARTHVVFALQHLTEREVLVSREAVLQVAAEHARGRVGMRALDTAFARLTEETRTVRSQDGERTQAPLLKQAKDGRWMLEQAYQSERYTVRTVKQEEGNVVPLASPEQAIAPMKRLEKGESANGSTGQTMTFSPEQRRAVLLVASAPARYVSIQGDAGSGKTTVVGAIREVGQAQGYVVKGMAVTGNATLALEKASGIESMTVARFILEERARTKLVRAFDRVDQGVHPRAKELWIVDEASMLGQADFGRLVHYAENAGARVVFVGDRRQLPAVPAGKPWEIVQDLGTPQAELKDNIRQRDPGERAAVDQVKRKDNAGALRTLAELGKVVVDASPVELIARLAKEWQGHSNAGERPTVGVVTHRARLAVNQAIRGERKRAGEIVGKEVNVTILESMQWTRAQIRSVVSYADAGETLRVRFRRNYRSLGVTQGEYGEVVSVDEAKGRIILNIEGRSVSWQPMRHPDVEVYRTAERSIARGDWIITTREHSALGNASQWEVTGIDETKRAASVRSIGGTRTEHFQLDQMPHWDHAYARTLHSLQGSTANRFMLYVEAQNKYGAPGKISDRVLEEIFGARGFYVGVTRQREGITIYTNDREVLAASIEKQREKTSALEGIREVGRVRGAA